MENEVRYFHSCKSSLRSLKVSDVSGLPRAERFRSTLQFILLPCADLYATLDGTKAADYTILGLSTEQEVDDRGDLLLRCLQAQGLPQVVAVACVSTYNSLGYVFVSSLRHECV